MSEFQTTLVWCLAVAFAGYFNCDCAKISTPRVLLPWFENSQVNYTFEITEGGCYSWSLSRDDIIDLDPLYDDSWGHCSRSARVSVSKNCAPPGTVIILAEEVNTGEILRGDVDIDTIKSIKVMSTTWKLFLEEAPEAFEVVAYDDQGNKFSTLEGISFKWTIQNLGNTVNEEPLVTLVRWRDTDYSPPKGIAELESSGLRGHTALLYGQAMGECRVNVCLESVCSDFDLQVVASVVLTPAMANVAPGDTVQYRVVRARAGRLSIEDVQDTLYHIYLPDTSYANLEDLSTVRATHLGQTTVQLMSGVTEVATSVLNVVEPHSIRIKIRPGDVVVKGELFVIQCLVLDKSGHPLHSGAATLIRLSTSGADVDLIRSNNNGTVTDAAAYTAGEFAVTARLHSINERQLGRKVESATTATVVDPLQVVPDELFVAWTNTIIQIPLNHSGGGNEPVTWSESETQHQQHSLSFSHEGTLTVRGEGDANVKVQLKNYAYVQGFGKVWSACPEYVQVTSSGQALVNTPHHLHVSLTATHKLTGELYNFHVCDCASMKLTHMEGPEPMNITAVKHVTPMDGACCVLSVTYSAPGLSSLYVSWSQLTSSTLVSVLSAPRIYWPTGVASIVGGKLPVLASGEALSPASSEPRVLALTPRDASPPHRYPDMQIYTASCLKSGEAVLQLSSSVFPELPAARAEVRCAGHAASLRLHTHAKDTCLHPRLWLRTDQETVLHVTLFDSIGRELLDESGPRASWEITPKHNGIEYKATDRLFVETLEEYYPVPVPSRFYQVFKVDPSALGWSGTVKVTVPEASASIQAAVVAPLTCHPMQVNLAFEPNQLTPATTISGGSEHYSASGRGLRSTVDDNIVKVTAEKPGVYELMVADECVHDSKVVELTIEEIVTVEIQTSRAVCVNSCVPLTSIARGLRQKELAVVSSPHYTTSGNVEVRENMLCGVREGKGAVMAAIAGVESAEVEVIVFPPLEVVPSKLTLVPTARQQLQHVGGPPVAMATLTYSLKDESSSIEISAWGAVLALAVGTARVRLSARDLMDVEMATAEAVIEVVPLTSLQISSPVSTVLLPHPAPLYLTSSRAPPAALAALSPTIRPIWTLRDPKAGGLCGSYYCDNTDSPTAEGVSVRFLPKRPGPVIIDVKVDNIGHITSPPTFSSHIELLVLPPTTITIEGSVQTALQTDGISMAVRATVQVKVTPRATCSHKGDGFVVTPTCEVTALVPGHGALYVQGNDEHNIYRETVVPLYAANPHFATLEPSLLEPEYSARVVLRDNLARPLLSPNVNLTTVPRLGSAHNKYSVSGPEHLLPSSDAATFVTVEASHYSAVVTDAVWLPPPVKGDRIAVTTGAIFCLEGAGWTGPSSVRLYPATAGSTVGMVSTATAGGRIVLENAGETKVLMHVPVEKISLEPSLGLTTPLALSPLMGGTSVLCSERLRAAASGLTVEVPWKCRVTSPHRAIGTVDFGNGKIGCTVIPASEILEPSEVELCADWGRHRTCTKTTLYPPITVDNTKLSLLDTTSFTIHGHPSLLHKVQVTPSPGLIVNKKIKNNEITVKINNDDLTCGSGFVVVDCVYTEQQIRVDVVKECDAVCGSLLGAILAALWPHVSTITTVIGVAAASYYFLTRQSKPSPSPSTLWSPSPPAAVRPPSPRPRSPPRPARPLPPVYGDASQLPDQSFSPNSTLHSRFL